MRLLCAVALGLGWTSRSEGATVRVAAAYFGFARPAVCARVSGQPLCVQLPSVPPTDEGDDFFDTALAGVLSDSEATTMDAALDSWLPRLDETFLPMLAERIEAAPADAAELPQWRALMEALQERSQAGYERARDQLQELLGAGEIHKMDARLAALVKRDEVDAGLFYVLMRNLQDAQASGDEGGARLLWHIHTRLQEELEKRTEPALALLHKLTRTADASIRANILRDKIVPKTETLLPDGSTLPLAKPSPAIVKPLELASAIEGALEKVLRLPVDRSAIEDACEEIRQVAKEARGLIATEYDQQTLDEFSEALTPAFAAALPARPAGEPRLVQP
jgi:hypothetical protein